MKYLHYLLIFSLFIGCNSKKDKYLEIAHRFNQSIKIIEQQNSEIYSDFESKYNQEIYGSPKIVPWYKKTSVIKSETQELIELIDSITKKCISQYEKDFNINDPIIAKVSGKLEKSDIDTLKEALFVYKGFLKGIISDIKPNENFSHILDNEFIINEWSEINCLSSKKTKLSKIVACIYKIKADVRITENDVLLFIYSHVGVEGDYFYGMKIIVEPNSKLIPLGKKYQARIYPAFYDTTITNSFEVEGKYYTADNGKGFYRQKIIEKPGKYSKNGSILYKKITTGEYTRAPFKIEYEVLKKK